MVIVGEAAAAAVVVIVVIVVGVVAGLFENMVLLQVHQPPAVLYFGPVFNGRLWANRLAPARGSDFTG